MEERMEAIIDKNNYNKPDKLIKKPIKLKNKIDKLIILNEKIKKVIINNENDKIIKQLLYKQREKTIEIERELKNDNQIIFFHVTLKINVFENILNQINECSIYIKKKKNKFLKRLTCNNAIMKIIRNEIIEDIRIDDEWNYIKRMKE
jgi:hypothetical protein